MPRASLSLVVAALALLSACAKSSGSSLPSTQLDQAIGGAIGDPTTCVLIADKASGKVLYRYGQLFNCRRGLPPCDRPGSMSAQGALALAAVPARGQSCPSNAQASRQVGWAEGVIGGASGTLIYSAVMEGDRALPGHEMNVRLYDVWTKTGLAR